MNANQGYSVDGLYTVTGVYKDFPQNSSYKFQWMSPYVVFENKNDWMKPWDNNLTETLVELNPAVNPESINKKLAGYLKRQNGRSFRGLYTFFNERLESEKPVHGWKTGRWKY